MNTIRAVTFSAFPLCLPTLLTVTTHHGCCHIHTHTHTHTAGGTTAVGSEQHLDLAMRLFLRVASGLTCTTLIYFEDKYSKGAVMEVGHDS